MLHPEALGPNPSPVQLLTTGHFCDWDVTLRDKIPYAPGVAHFLCVLQSAEAAAHATDNHPLATARPDSRYRATIPVNNL